MYMITYYILHITYYILYMIYDIWYMICDILYVIHYILYNIYDIQYTIYDIWYMIYYISYIIYHISYIYIIYILYFIHDIWYMIYDTLIYFNIFYILYIIYYILYILYYISYIIYYIYTCYFWMTLEKNRHVTSILMALGPLRVEEWIPRPQTPIKMPITMDYCSKLPYSPLDPLLYMFTSMWKDHFLDHVRRETMVFSTFFVGLPCGRFWGPSSLSPALHVVLILREDQLAWRFHVLLAPVPAEERAIPKSPGCVFTAGMPLVAT